MFAVTRIASKQFFHGIIRREQSCDETKLFIYLLLSLRTILAQQVIAFQIHKFSKNKYYFNI